MQPSLLYLEADDEVTSVVRRVRSAAAGRVIIVVPGRSRATSSAVALRLLARAGEEDGREVAVVGDPLTRSLAVEAGLAAYATVDDARAADGPVAESAEPRHASIHVVRGADDEATAPTAVAPAVTSDAATRQVVVTKPVRGPRGAARFRGVTPLVAVLGVAGAVLLTGMVAAAAILPTATIRLTPRVDAIGPVTYRISVDDPQRVEGTVEETATVTATGTYAIQSPATGTVVFLNWNIVPVTVLAGTFVAAGEQAFATEGEVVVPRGRLTGAGVIQAGEQSVPVVAAAVGPAANLPAEAIDTILDDETAARLRGFPENPEQLVVNPEATAGGVDTTGPEITQADVDAAVAALREALATAAAEALGQSNDLLHADAPTPSEPVISGTDDLVGRRDVPSAEIGGELSYDRLGVEHDRIEELARERFMADDDVVPDGRQLLDESMPVDIGAVERQEDRLVVEAAVRGRVMVEIDAAVVRDRVIGLSEAEAEAALADLGEAEVELWPGWVSTVPESEWRLDVQIVGGQAAEPLPTGS